MICLVTKSLFSFKDLVLVGRSYWTFFFIHCWVNQKQSRNRLKWKNDHPIQFQKEASSDFRLMNKLKLVVDKKTLYTSRCCFFKSRDWTRLQPVRKQLFHVRPIFCTSFYINRIHFFGSFLNPTNLAPSKILLPKKNCILLLAFYLQPIPNHTCFLPEFVWHLLWLYIVQYLQTTLAMIQNSADSNNQRHK